MLQLINEKLYYHKGKLLNQAQISNVLEAEKCLNAYKGTMSYKILNSHNISKSCLKNETLNIKFDAIASHDITYVGIVQTAKASGLKSFPLPYVLTNCHNSLCAVGGTINEDDHIFGLSAAKKYGGIYVPSHLAVIHTYMRENMAGVGKMILGSDSHTRYGALGTMACGEGGPELVKQILNKTYDITYPDVIAIHLKGNVCAGVGPQDVALSIIKAVFKNGFVKNKIMEFVGDGIKNLSVEFRNGIDVMTTETTCLSSIWVTDDKVQEYLKTHKREGDFKTLAPDDFACYDGAVIVELDKIKPQIAMPFHPSNVYDLCELIAHPNEIIKEVEENGKKLLSNPNYSLAHKIVNGKLVADQGIIAGCAGGTYDNIYMAGKMLKNKNVGNGKFNLSVYPSSQPIYLNLIKDGSVESLLSAGAVMKTAFCGPCFGAGDVPCNNGFSIRHTTRNFENREGSKPTSGQVASVALMDARSIAATSANGGVLTSATDFDLSEKIIPKFYFDNSPYLARVYDGVNKPEADLQLSYGPNILDWPKVESLNDNLLVKLCAVINDEVTTTDELIPSGETSSYRSNPLKLSEFTLSRKEPLYVPRTKEVQVQSQLFKDSKPVNAELSNILNKLGNVTAKNLNIASGIFAVKPGDGSAREQAVSCQRVLGGAINIAREYATKRYRSNLINWGIIPFIAENFEFCVNDYIYFENIKNSFKLGKVRFCVKVFRGRETFDTVLSVDRLDETQTQLILDGCLMNYYKNNN